MSTGAMVVGTSTGGLQRVVIGIGEQAVAGADSLIVTHALGRCVAVCLWDPGVRIGAMLHFLLPESRVNPERARKQPSTFADTGIPLLIAQAVEQGLNKKRCRAHLFGGTEPRTVNFSVADGQFQVTHGRERVQEL